MKKWRAWIAQRRVGFWFSAVLLAGLAALALAIDRTQPHLGGELLRYDTFVERVESGDVLNARILNYDSFAVGTYRRPNGRLAQYRTTYFKSYGGAGQGNQNPLLDLLVINRVPVQIEQQIGKGIASVLIVILPALLSIVALLYLIVSWRRSSGLFARGGGPRRVDPDDSTVTFEDIAGQDAAVDELREIADYLGDPERFASVGSTIPRGVLLYGPPGSGKTLMARALAGEVGATFYYVSGAEFVELYVGVGASRVRSLFEEARKNVPAIIFIDELDAIGQRRAAPDRSERGDEQEQALNQILTEMDGFVGSEGVIVLAATNRPDVLDPALLRPGRFDRSVALERTDEAGRLAILRLHARDRPLAEDVDLPSIARRGVGLTGAEIANLVNEAGLLAVRAGAHEISAAHLEEAMRRVREAPERQRRLSMRGSTPGRQVISSERVGFADIAGLDNVIEELREIEAYLDEPEAFERMGARAPRGHLIVGPPGVGKTMIVRAVAHEANAAFFWISASEFMERYVGVGASRVRDLFAEARGVAPAIVFIDEIDAIGQRRSGAGDGGSREADVTLNQILIEMDGFTGSEAVVVMGATNRPEILDPALVRPGRFDRTITIDLPHRDARREILKVHARKKPLSPNVDLNSLAGTTSGFSGADLANLLNEAALLAIRRRKRQISTADIGDAMDRVVLGIAGGRRMSDRDRKIVAYHESGHAVLGYLLPGANIPHRVSVMPRGRMLGVVLRRDDEHVAQSRSMLLDEMASFLGGLAAEEVVFGEVTSGGSSDLRQVNRLARQMVLELGMSEGLGRVAPGADRDRDRDHLTMSEDTSRRVDAEVARLVSEAQARARDVLERERDLLDRVATAVMEREVLSAEELEAILGPTPA